MTKTRPTTSNHTVQLETRFPLGLWGIPAASKVVKQSSIIDTHKWLPHKPTTGISFTAIANKMNLLFALSTMMLLLGNGESRSARGVSGVHLCLCGQRPTVTPTTKNHRRPFSLHLPVVVSSRLRVSLMETLAMKWLSFCAVGISTNRPSQALLETYRSSTKRVPRRTHATFFL
jgi:hypothetical protein